MRLSPFLTVVLIVVAIAIIVGVVLLVRRHRYVTSLTERGWTFEEHPTLASTYGLNAPPFGLGYDRRIDDVVSGTTNNGVPFRAFEYGTGDHYTVALTLPRTLPTAFITVPGEGRPGAQGVAQQFGAWQVVSDDPAFGSALASAALHVIDGVAASQPINLSVDGAHLVATGAPKEAAELSAFLDNLGLVAAAVAQADLSAFPAPSVPAELSLYGHPDWVYRPQDDRFLSEVNHTTAGADHEAKDVVLAVLDGGMRMIGLTHHWTTTHAESSTDANGNTTTRTVTEHHSEPIIEVALPWHFGDLSLNWPWTGSKVPLESADFNEAYVVRSEFPKFATDVFHPRMMEFIQRSQPVPFAITQGRLRFDSGSTEPAMMEWVARFTVAFFAGVPRFVWEDLGNAEAPINPELAGYRG